MPIIAMRATSASDHPNADSLRVYLFDAPDREPVQVIANLETVYEVGSVAAVALVGTTLLDGTAIKRTKLRGVASLGMAMGTTDAAPGTDLSEGRCKPEVTLGKGHLLKWTSIELLHNIRRDVLARAELEGTPVAKVRYRAKVKLHGTNAGVQILPDGSVVPQGRNHVLTAKDHNAGFATWVLDNVPAFEQLAQPDRHLTLYGEWCGTGIQKGVAICGIGRKVFVVFAAQLGDHHAEAATVVTEPAELLELVPKHPDVFVLPWYGDPVTVDFADPDPPVATLNAMVEAVEKNDPWVQAVFDVPGIGEGLVLYPQLDTKMRDAVTPLMFKAKGDKHRVRKSKKAVEASPEVVRSVKAFVTTFATDTRFAQGLSEVCSPTPTMKELGTFLKWVCGDVKKESVDDLAAAGLTWNQVVKGVTTAARTWFKARIG